MVLENDSDVVAVAAELNRWAAIWGMGRPDIPVDILESTLAHGGSYGMRWAPGGQATITATYRGELFCGPLVEALAFIAKNLPYNHGHEIDDEEY